MPRAQEGWPVTEPGSKLKSPQTLAPAAPWAAVAYPHLGPLPPPFFLIVDTIMD